MAKFNHLDIRGTKRVPSAFGNVFICSGATADAKTITFPDGYLNGATPEPNLAFKCVFANGHNAANASSYLSLNGIVIVSNQNGVLAPIPIHAMTEGGSTVYKVLQANTVLELYYTADYDGNGTPAFVIVGNPLVLSSATYSIYANGQVGDEQIATVKPTFLASAPYGWLLCDDTVRHKADYPKLWDEIPAVFKNTSNNTFVIDLQGRAVMGADSSTPIGQSQPDATSAAHLSMDERLDADYEWIGSASADNGTGTTIQKGGAPGNFTTTGQPEVRLSGGAAYTIGVKSFIYNLKHAHAIRSTDSETRPKNVRMNWIIKAK